MLEGAHTRKGQTPKLGVLFEAFNVIFILSLLKNITIDKENIANDLYFLKILKNSKMRIFFQISTGF